MATFCFNLTLSVRGPVLTRSTAAGNAGLDAPFARNERDQPIIPGSLLKGRIREAFEELAEYGMPDADSWFGPRVGTQRFNTRFFISDLVMQEEESGGWRHRIRRNEDTCAADEQMMQVLESPIAAGKSCDFAGTVRFDARDTETAEFVRVRILKALKWAGCVGANTSTGYGTITDVKVKSAPEVESGITDPYPAGDRVWLRLNTKDLLCVTEERTPGGNLFISGFEIPGAVLKGAVASAWMRLLGKDACTAGPGIDPQRPTLSEHFAQLRFSHARPSNEGKRPVAIPLSVGSTGKTLVDFAMLANPPAESPVVSFSSDWKWEWNVVEPVCGWPPKQTELRVRTAIDSTRRRAKDESLFAYEMVRPDDSRGWYCTINLGSIPKEKREAARKELIDLLTPGITGVGKTKASFGVELLASEPPAKIESKLSPVDGRWVVTLQTPALFADPRPLIGSRSANQLKAGYSAAFAEASGNSLTLDHFFALQDLRGGNFLRHRFQAGSTYEPYLLTRAGSVFVLRAEKGKEAKAQQTMENWFRCGLPVPQWARERFQRGDQDGAHWTNNPYLPENGYGEIAVNQQIDFDQENTHE